MRLRQIALVARDLEPVVDDLCAVFGLDVGYRDPGVQVFGLRNAVLPVGDTFLEVVSPVDPNASAARLLARRGGDSGYMVILQTQGLEEHRKRLASLGVRVVWEAALDDIATIHLHPRDVGAAILSLDEAWPPDSWRWAGPWRSLVRTERVRGLRGAVLQAEDPQALAQQWSRVLDLPLSAGETPDETARIDLDGGTLRFTGARDGRGDGLAGVEIEAADRATCLATAAERGLAAEDDDVIVICGTRIVLV
jgi:hypothetical protein